MTKLTSNSVERQTLKKLLKICWFGDKAHVNLSTLYFKLLLKNRLLRKWKREAK